MFKVRKEQMAVFEEAAIQNLEERTLDYLAASLPFHSEVLGEIGLREVVRLGRQRAAGYGITAEGGVQRYLLLMFGMGSHFDRDALLPWGSMTRASFASSCPRVLPKRAEPSSAPSATISLRARGARPSSDSRTTVWGPCKRLSP